MSMQVLPKGRIFLQASWEGEEETLDHDCFIIVHLNSEVSLKVMRTTLEAGQGSVKFHVKTPKAGEKVYKHFPLTIAQIKRMVPTATAYVLRGREKDYYLDQERKHVTLSFYDKEQLAVDFPYPKGEFIPSSQHRLVLSPTKDKVLSIFLEAIPFAPETHMVKPFEARITPTLQGENQKATEVGTLAILLSMTLFTPLNPIVKSLPEKEYANHLTIAEGYPQHDRLIFLATILLKLSDKDFKRVHPYSLIVKSLLEQPNAPEESFVSSLGLECIGRLPDESLQAIVSNELLAAYGNPLLAINGEELDAFIMEAVASLKSPRGGK